jgi:hypothetical protein
MGIKVSAITYIQSDHNCGYTHLISLSVYSANTAERKNADIQVEDVRTLL